MAPDDWRLAGLSVIDDRDQSSLVAASSTLTLERFVQRLEAYRTAVASAKGTVTNSALFDAISDVRWFGPEDRLSDALRSRIAAPDLGDPLVDIDIELWYPRNLGDGSDQDEAYRWLAIVRTAFADAGTEVDQHLDHDIGLLLLRVRTTLAVVARIATLGEIAAIDLAPSFGLASSEVDSIEINSLPAPRPATDQLPYVAVVDSGVSASHPLLTEVLYEARTLLPTLGDPADECGHGTGVAGIAVYGPTEDWIADYVAGIAPEPAARLISYRVLDHQNRFPRDVLWERAVADAIRAAAASGATIVNLSIGNEDGAQTTRRATRCAAILDQLARELNLVIVVPTGNSRSDSRGFASDPRSTTRYLKHLVESEDRALLDPAPAALALTVGGTAGGEGRLRLGEVALGRGRDPSAITRRGPGTGRGVKPELVAPAGTLAWNDTIGAVERASLKRLVLSHAADSLFARDLGTSFAAPVVTNAAVRVRAEHAAISGCLVRALLLQSAVMAPLETDHLAAVAKTAADKRRLSVLGHGTVDAARAVHSSDNRAVLIDDTTIRVDSVVVYEIPLPEVFFNPGGTRGLDVALAFDPLTRYRRQDYLGSRLFGFWFHGPTVEDLVRILGQADDDELEASDESLPNAQEDTSDEIREQPDSPAPAPTRQRRRSEIATPGDANSLSELAKWRKVTTPGTTTMADSANILMRWRGSRALDRELGPTALLAIRSTGRWSPVDREDRLGVAVSVGYEGKDQAHVYAELKARIAVQVPVEQAIRVRSET